LLLKNGHQTIRYLKMETVKSGPRRQSHLNQSSLT
jgi:hypothetical protein